MASGKKKTRQVFVEEMAIRMPNIKVIGEYVNDRTHIKCSCNICGNVWDTTTAGHLLEGHGCPECAKLKSKRPRKTHEQFVEQMKKVNPNISVLENYETSAFPIECMCKVCGHKWKARPAGLLQGSGCPICSRRKTHEQFVVDLNKKNAQISVISPYKGHDQKIKCKCEICGNEWISRPKNLLMGLGCPACAIRYVSGLTRKTRNQFINEMEKINPNIEIVGEYESTNKRIECKCKICGFIWDSSTPSNLLRGEGCPKCGREKQAEKRRKTQEQFLFEMRETNDTIAIISKYTGDAKLVECECKICGHIWKTRPSNLLRGRGCPACAKSGTSFMEQFIYLAFREILGENEVRYRDRRAIGKELDIYIPSYKFAIEPGAWGWHKDKLENDLKKMELCKSQGIRLIIIYDQVPENVSFKDKDILTYTDYLGDNPNILMDLTKRLLNICGITEITLDIDKLTELAVSRCRKKTTDIFIEEMRKVNPTIEIIGKYVSNGTKIKCRCKVCNTVLENATPSSLLQGHGCPKCRGGVKRTHEDFVKEMKSINPNIEILGTYINNSTKIRCRCKICGEIWDAIPKHLIKGASHKGWKYKHMNLC